jgi:hypothetical protein
MSALYVFDTHRMHVCHLQYIQVSTSKSDDVTRHRYPYRTVTNKCTALSGYSCLRYVVLLGYTPKVTLTLSSGHRIPCIVTKETTLRPYICVAALWLYVLSMLSPITASHVCSLIVTLVAHKVTYLQWQSY